MLGPVVHLGDFGVDAGGIPVFEAVADDVQAVHWIGNQFGGFSGAFRIGGIGDAAQVVPVVHRPVGALVREDVRLVEVKRVDDVRVAQRLEENQVVIVGPVRAGGDDGVLRGAFANGGGELGLDAVPAIAVAALGLVEDFEEDPVGIEFGVMRGQGAPEIGEALDGVIVGGQLLLEIYPA